MAGTRTTGIYYEFLFSLGATAEKLQAVYDTAGHLFARVPMMRTHR